ncbi:GSCFA domain-containing protein [Glaciecola siphonariae]|uniref:GSCFA domain-containing protein n=1 Tax=Glaciecola siphonariae TaxID=521012 RepID=A0ABV9M0J5_9ALTE
MNPYQNMPDDAFWKSAVASQHMLDIAGLWKPKFAIRPAQKVVTFGSCFAQHIGRALKQRGYNWLSTEKAPHRMSAEDAARFNYDIFSSRTGNIYTTSLLDQWTNWALGYKEIPSEIWEKDGRFYDPFRPNIEPQGFASADEVVRSRQYTVDAFGRAIKSAEYFVFTLGLTESWTNQAHEYEYPMCPGTVAGEFNGDIHKFTNQQFVPILERLRNAMEKMRKVNPKLRFILTVSPVPLTATASGKHVLVATMASKSILRAVAEQLSSNRQYVDYFPSYEIINSPVFKGNFFMPNLRSVHPKGVAFVMENFFAALPQANKANKTKVDATQAQADEVCEELMLAHFKN